MWRKSLEDVKIGIENIENCITEARTLEIISFDNMPARPSILSSTWTSSESYELEDEDEDEGVELEHDDEGIYEQALDPSTPDKDSRPFAPKSVIPENAPTFEASKTSASYNLAD